MDWLISILFVAIGLPVLFCIYGAFFFAIDSFHMNKRKPKNPRERLIYARDFFLIVLFPWILMCGGVIYFYQLLGLGL